MGAILLAALIAGCGNDGSSRPLVTYRHDFGGFVGGHEELRVEADGSTTAATMGPPAACRDGSWTHRLSRDELAGLQAALQRVPDVRPRSRSFPGPEASDLRIETGGVTLHYHGLGSTAPAALPVVTALRRAIAAGCPERHRAAP